MAKQRSVYRCQECGESVFRWVGQCPSCRAWGSVVEEAASAKTGSSSWGTGGVGEIDLAFVAEDTPVPLLEVQTDEAHYRATGLTEFDRVLGGGLVPASAILLGGEPGIGKSTLTLQVLHAVAEQRVGPSLLVTAEESKEQVRVRAERLAALSPGFLVVAETSVPAIIGHLHAVRPSVVVVDSIQMVRDPRFESAAGSVVQVRESAALLVAAARELGVAVILVGHVTKDGTLAGPRVLEHLVDVVLLFEGDRHHAFRTLRGVKNRFGPVGELGLFDMTDRGLLPLSDASEVFLSGRQAGVDGSAVAAAMEGRRPVLVEVQALVSSAPSGVPRRSVTGVDPNRVNVLAGVLEKRLGLACGRGDLYVSIAGGVRVTDPAVDLALCAAIASSATGNPLPEDFVWIGEVGLGGEVRSVAAIDRRVAEAARFGFRTIVTPAVAAEVASRALSSVVGEKGEECERPQVRGVNGLVEGLDLLLG